MKKLFPGILAMLLCFGCLVGCGDKTPDSTPDSTPNDSTPVVPDVPAQEHDGDLKQVKEAVLVPLASYDSTSNKDYTVPNSYSFYGEEAVYDISWAVTDAEGNAVTGVTVEAGTGATDVVKISVEEDTPYVLKATVTCPDGCCTLEYTLNRTASAAPVPVAITEAPVENVAYKLYVYEGSAGKDCFITGEPKSDKYPYYWLTTSDYTASIDVYAKNVEGGFNLYHVVDGTNVYLNIVKVDTHTNSLYQTLEDNATPSVWTYDATMGTVVVDLNGTTCYLGCDGGYDTVEAQYKTGDGYYVGYLCTMKDKSEIVITDEDKVSTTLDELNLTLKYTLDKRNIILPTNGSKYQEVSVSWSVEADKGATLTQNILDLVIPAEKTTVVLTATVACGDVTETKTFELELGPKTVVTDSSDPASILAAAFNLAPGEALEGKYTLTGEIKTIKTPYDEQHKNITVIITIGDKEMECYRLKGSDTTDASALKVGDTITVSGSIKNHYGKLEFDAGCTLDAVTTDSTGGETPDPTPDPEPDVPAATENKADFNTIDSDGFGQYTKTFTTANGWTTVNAALQVGGPSVANPAYPVVGADKTSKAVCLNGKTSAPGKLTSPTLNGGISVLNLKYTKMFTDLKLGAKIIVTDLATGATQETTISRDVEKDNDKYVVWTYEWILETAITGDFTIEVVNTCPSEQDGNKDRLTILELSWIATTGGETPDPTPDPEPDVPEIETLTIAEAIAKAAEQGAGKYTTEMYYVIGKITEVQSAQWGNVVITDGTNDILVYGMYIDVPDSDTDTRYDAMETKPLVGDTVKLLSVVGMYNTTKQLKDAFLIEITAATDAEKVAVEKDALTLTDAVTGASSIALVANGASRADVAISWEVTAGNEIATISNGKLEITNPTAETTVTVKATITCGESIDSKTFDIVVSVLEAGEAAVTIADFKTLTVGTSYTTGKTTNGWSVAGAAVFQNGSANSGSSFSAITAGEKAICLNGKTSNVGKLTSPILTTGVSKISFNYAHFFGENNGVDITINVKNSAGQVVATHNMKVANASVVKLTGYAYEWVLETAVTEDCTVEVVNNSPSKNGSSNKDRVAIWNFAVTGVVS